MKLLPSRACCIMIGACALFPALPALGQYVSLHSFAGNNLEGRYPESGTLAISGSTLYGVTSNFGAGSGNGTVYAMGTNGAGFTVLHSFDGGTGDGSDPHG